MTRSGSTQAVVLVPICPGKCEVGRGGTGSPEVAGRTVATLGSMGKWSPNKRGERVSLIFQGSAVLAGRESSRPCGAGKDEAKQLKPR